MILSNCITDWHLVETLLAHSWYPRKSSFEHIMSTSLLFFLTSSHNFSTNRLPVDAQLDDNSRSIYTAFVHKNCSFIELMYKVTKLSTFISEIQYEHGPAPSIATPESNQSYTLRTLLQNLTNIIPHAQKVSSLPKTSQNSHFMSTTLVILVPFFFWIIFSILIIKSTVRLKTFISFFKTPSMLFPAILTSSES